jgi:hypothetical protein
METQKKLPPLKRRRLWPVAVGGLLLLAVVLLVTLAAYNPRSYAPLIPENPQQVSPYLTHTLGPDFYNNVQMDEPFELIVEQAGLNDIFSRYPWPFVDDGISVYTPMISISPQQTVLMAQVDFKGLSTILSVYGSPCLDSEGMMNLNIQSVYLGALPITPLARSLAKQYVLEHFNLNDPIEAVNLAFVTNQPFDPVVQIAGHTARITELNIEPARARLVLKPIKR